MECPQWPHKHKAHLLSAELHKQATTGRPGHNPEPKGTLSQDNDQADVAVFR